MSQADAGLLLAGGSGLCVLVRVAAGAWIDRTGADPIFFMVGLMVAGAAGFVALSGSGQWLIVVAALVAFGAGWGWPGSSSSSS